MSRVLILHAYSADNKGDGLLVRETLNLLREALGPDTELHIAASYPHSFAGLAARVWDSQPRTFGYDRDYVRMLRNMDEYDLVIGVGGGYLRAGRPLELAKAALVHGPQLWAASRSDTRTLYLPQSIGPLRLGSRALAKKLLGLIDNVIVRDDRSLAEITANVAERGFDLALLEVGARRLMKEAPDPVPVISVRKVHGRIPDGVRELTANLPVFEGYVQSSAGQNNDLSPTKSLNPTRILTHREFLDEPTRPRVVVAVRLHAALMALNAGHYVVHLSYERKGFGAFNDLGLNDYVHNVNAFDASFVAQQVRTLTSSPEIRSEYAAAVDAARLSFRAYRLKLVELMRSSRSHEAQARTRGGAGGVADSNSDVRQG